MLELKCIGPHRSPSFPQTRRQSSLRRHLISTQIGVNTFAPHQSSFITACASFFSLCQRTIIHPFPILSIPSDQPQPRPHTRIRCLPQAPTSYNRHPDPRPKDRPKNRGRALTSSSIALDHCLTNFLVSAYMMYKAIQILSSNELFLLSSPSL